MANDVVNATAGVGTGNQNIGRISVLTGGRGSLGNLTDTINPGNFETINITTVSGKYDTKFDDQRYYAGDAIT
jgi:hypothetical protein